MLAFRVTSAIVTRVSGGGALATNSKVSVPAAASLTGRKTGFDQPPLPTMPAASIVICVGLPSAARTVTSSTLITFLSAATLASGGSAAMAVPSRQVKRRASFCSGWFMTFGMW